MASRQIRTLMLCLFAVFAFSAVAASTASAKHTWWRCHEVAAGKGEFTEKLCATKVKTKGEAAGIFESEAIPAAQATTTSIKSKAFILTAGTTTITCEALTVKEGKIENIEAENIEKTKGKTGRDKGTVEFSKCKSSIAGCTVTEPIKDKGKESALVEQFASPHKIYDMFAPEGWKEESTKANAEKIKPFAKIIQEPKPACVNTEVEGNGVAAEIEPEGYSVAKVLKFPGENAACEPKGKPLTPVNLWNGVNEVNLALEAFAVPAQECGEATLELASKEAFDVK